MIIGASGGWSSLDGPLPERKDLELPNGTPPKSFRYTTTCTRCIFHKTKSYQYPHGDGKNWDLGCVPICIKHNFVVDDEYMYRTCDDFIMDSWELRGKMSKEERIKVLLDLRKDGIEVKGINRNISNGDLGNLQKKLGRYPTEEDIPDILEDI